jgi:hypothetical protein
MSDTNEGQTTPSNISLLDFLSRQKTASQEKSDDFAHFKAIVDKDPFDAVFGRRLTSNQKPTDTSWSSFSWMFEAKTSKEGQKTSQEPVASNTPLIARLHSIASSSGYNTRGSIKTSPNNDENLKPTSSKPPNTHINSTGQVDEYEFDPISMRKVLKSKPTMATVAKPSKSLFDPLFAEKGVDISVKPYKPHRVFGYTTKSSSQRDPLKAHSPDSKAVKSKAETSRLVELRKLKAANLGNSIDTTAEYHGKWIPASETLDESPEKELIANSVSDEAPLFSGTTYEAKSEAILKGASRSKQDWLDREGFGSKPESLVSETYQQNAPEIEHPRKKAEARLQPSLDCIKSASQASDKLEPSLDRLTAPSKKAMRFQSSRILGSYDAQESTNEGLDLLRASDVRASPKPARRSRQDSEQTKKYRRQKLENDFESRQKDDDGISIVFPNTILESSKKLSESLNNLWHRLRAQQKTWLTGTVESLSNIKDTLVENLGQSADQKKPEAISTEVKTAQNVQKSASKSIQTFTPSQEVLDAEQQSKARTLALRQATLDAKNLEAESKVKENALAQKLKATYEDEYGPITADHRQIKGTDRVDQLAKKLDGAILELDQHFTQLLVDMWSRYRMEVKTSHREVMQKVKAIRARWPSSTDTLTTEPIPLSRLVTICEARLKDARNFQAVASQQVEAIRAGREASSATLPPTRSMMSSDSKDMQPEREEQVTRDDAAENSAVEAEQTPSATTDAPPSRAPLLYKVLAYDSSTLQMTIAETTSSISPTEDAETQLLNTTEVLSRLNNVAKFLPYFADMEKQGYEIVSGSGDMLVFRRVRASVQSAEATSKTSNVDMKDLTNTSSPPWPQQNLAESASQSITPNASSSKVRRQEDVFSGSGQKWHEEGGSSGSSSNKDGSEQGWFRKTVKRVFLAGTFTAAVAYTIGVVAEQAGAQVQEVGSRRSGRPGIYSTENSR